MSDVVDPQRVMQGGRCVLGTWMLSSVWFSRSLVVVNRGPPGATWNNSWKFQKMIFSSCQAFNFPS